MSVLFVSSRFAELGCIPRAFCSVEYVGTRTSLPPTDFSGLRSSVAELLRNNAVRAPRRPEVVLKALQVGGTHSDIDNYCLCR